MSNEQSRSGCWFTKNKIKKNKKKFNITGNVPLGTHVSNMN